MKFKRLFIHNLNYERTLKKFEHNLKRLCSIALEVRCNLIFQLGCIFLFKCKKLKMNQLYLIDKQ